MRPFLITFFVGFLGVVILVHWAEKDWRVPADAYPGRRLQPNEVWIQPHGIVDDRELRLREFSQFKETADILALGNSRINTLRSSNFRPTVFFFNAGIGSASLRELISLWEAYTSMHSSPTHLILYLDPLIIFRDRMTHTLNPFWQTFQKRHSETASVFMRSSKQKKNPMPFESIGALRESLLNPDRWFEEIYYFRGLFSWEGVYAASHRLFYGCSIKNKRAIVPQKERPSDQFAYAADGSVLYPDHSPSTSEIIRSILKVLNEDPEHFTFHNEASSSLIAKRLEEFLQDIHQRGTHVLIIIPPYHPVAGRWIQSRDFYKNGLESFLRSIRQTASSVRGIEFCDASDALYDGCSAAEFRDDIHPTEPCTQKVIESCTRTLPAWAPWLAEPLSPSAIVKSKSHA